MKRYILVVEDESDVRELIVEKIKAELDFEILEASNPQIALDLFHKYHESIECMISDYYMPIEDGVSLCQILKKDHPGLKVILLTGNHSVKEQFTGEEHINVVLYKPEGLEQLVKHIKEI